MPGSVLVAKVQRNSRRVELDGTVRPGASIGPVAPETEVVVLATSPVGHLVEIAHVLAVDLRKRGWAVTICPYVHHAVQPVQAGRPSPRAMVSAIETVLSGPINTPVASTVTQPRSKQKNKMRRFKCAECGLLRFSAGITYHQRRSGHAGRVYVDSVVGGRTAEGSERSEISPRNAEAPPEWDNPSERGNGVEAD